MCGGFGMCECLVIYAHVFTVFFVLFRLCLFILCMILFNSVSCVFYCYANIFLLLCMFCSVYSVSHHVNWHSSATLSEVFPCFSLSCKANTDRGSTVVKVLCYKSEGR